MPASPAGSAFSRWNSPFTPNGVEILDVTFESLAVAESFFHDSVINLENFTWGPTST